MSGGLCLLSSRPVASTWLCGGDSSLLPSMPLGDGMLGTEKQSQEEEERLACHAALPSSPVMRLQVSPGSSLKSLSRGSCSASRVWELLRLHLKPAEAGIFLGLSLLPAAGPTLPSAAPGEPSLSRGLGRTTGMSEFPGTGPVGEGGPVCL